MMTINICRKPWTTQVLVIDGKHHKIFQEVKPSMANKAELIEKVAEATDLTKKDATAAVDAVFSTIQEALANGEKVQLIGFGNFEVRSRAERKGRNPQTGEEIKIPASKVPAFKPGKVTEMLCHATVVVCGLKLY
jgi:DNA-binding protein HU-beta